MLETPSSITELDELISRPTDGVIDVVGDSPGAFAVLGAGGKMGLHVSLMLQRALRDAGRDDRVIVVSRFSDDASRRRFEAEGFDVRAVDLSDPRKIAQLERVPNVINLAGVKFGTSGDPELMHRLNITLPGLVAEHFRESRIVALSSGCAYSFTTPESGGSTEDGETNPPGEYAQSVLGRENEYVRAANDHGTRSVLIRLNYSVDLRYGVVYDIGCKLFAGEAVNVEMGYVNVIWQGDASAHIIQSLPEASSPPAILNVTGADILPVRDLAERFASRFGREAIVEGTEAETAWLSNPTRSHDLFGKPQVSIDEMIALTADWIERGGESLGKPTHFENRSGTY